jgi:hypothetical protein
LQQCNNKYSASNARSGEDFSLLLSAWLVKER